MTPANNDTAIVLAAGGTGGHIFPAEALAETLLAQGLRPVLVTDKRFKSYGAADFAGGAVTIHTIRAGTMGRGLFGKIKGALDIVAGFIQARRLLRRLAPKAVVGFGGYPSFPTVLASASLHIPTIIHEQNAVLGRANRMLARYVDAIAASLEDTQLIAPAEQHKVTLTGNPVRASVRALQQMPYPELPADGVMRLLVVGGSLGATVFSDVMPEAVALLPAPLRARLRIDQQCRDADIAQVREAYRALGASVDLATFFHDMPARLAGAHLVVARAGASTVAELAASGRPAILVPLPSAMDNHQAINADAVEAAGGGWVMPQDGFTPQAVAARLETLLTNPASLSKAAANMRRTGRPQAAEALASLVRALIGKRKRTSSPITGVHAA